MLRSILAQPAIAAIVSGCLVASSASAATLQYRYDFDNHVSGTTYTPSVGTNGTLGGNLSGNNANLVTAVGPSGAAADKAISNPVVYGNPSGSGLVGSTGSTNGAFGTFTAPANNTIALPVLSQFTIMAWVRPTAAALATGTFGRVMLVGPQGVDTGTAADSFGLSLANGTIETRIKSFGGAGGPVLAADTWNLIAVTYDGTATNPYFSPAQQTASGGLTTNNTAVYTATSSSPTVLHSSRGTNTGAAGAFNVSPGSVSIPNGFVYLMNRQDLGRGLQGLGDDFRIYEGILSRTEIEAIRQTIVPEPTSLAALALAGLTALRRRR